VGLHGLQNLQESARAIFVSLQISHQTSAEIALQINGLRVVQGGLKNALVENYSGRMAAGVLWISYDLAMHGGHV
jgi:hypothetical protein